MSILGTNLQTNFQISSNPSSFSFCFNTRQNKMRFRGIKITYNFIEGGKSNRELEYKNFAGIKTIFLSRNYQKKKEFS